MRSVCVRGVCLESVQAEADFAKEQLEMTKGIVMMSCVQLVSHP